MQRFLFRFGYCTPAQWRSSETHGWDDESSGAFFVTTDSQETALALGCEIAEQFVAYQFKLAKFDPIPSWRASDFAFWIEDNPISSFSAEQLAQLPEVEPKQIPDFSLWVRVLKVTV